MKDLFALLLGNGDLFSQSYGSSMEFPSDDNPNWSKTIESFRTKTHLVKKEIWTSLDGKIRMERMTSEVKKKVNVPKLKELLVKALEIEDYEKAAELRDMIKSAEE